MQYWRLHGQASCKGTACDITGSGCASWFQSGSFCVWNTLALVGQRTPEMLETLGWTELWAWLIDCELANQVWLGHHNIWYTSKSLLLWHVAYNCLKYLKNTNMNMQTGFVYPLHMFPLFDKSQSYDPASLASFMPTLASPISTLPCITIATV